MVAITTLVVLLDPELTATPAARSAAARHEHVAKVSLMRCVALTHQLKNILGAVERVALASELCGLTLTVNRYRVSVNGDPSEVMALDVNSALRRLQTRLVKALEPGLVAIDAAPSICDFRSRSIGPTLLPAFGGTCVGSSTMRLSNVSVFQIDEVTYRPRKLLGRWPLSRKVRSA